jgi:hypothetical protein
LGVILSVLSSVYPDVLGTWSKQTILSLTEREEVVQCSAQPSARTERLNPPPVKEETPCLAAVWGGPRQEGDHVSLLMKVGYKLHQTPTDIIVFILKTKELEFLFSSILSIF